MAGAERIEGFSEAEVAALQELAEIALLMKKSGLLGWLRTIAESGDKLVELAAAEYGLLRLLGLFQAVNAGIQGLEPGEFADARINAEKATKCLFAALSKSEPEKAPRVGLMGALRMMGDPDVQKGLGFLMMLAKNLGGCMRAGEEKA